ncbi:MAG: glycosyltransferase [Desulfuromonadales bacterium]|nr:glycosyltransferase [Desulfuromonadales bacterium]
MAVSQKRALDDDVFEAGDSRPLSRFATLMSRARSKYFSNQDYFFQDQSRSTLKSADEFVRSIDFKPDAIIVHWVSNFVSTDDIRALSVTYRAPVVWYLLDMAPITGGCHYAWDCTGYFRKCGRCPALNSNNENDHSHRIWQRKHLALQGIDLTVAAGSGWLERQAERSSLFHDRPIRKILLSVDPEIFCPVPKFASRQRLGLPEDKKIIFFGNQGLRLKRKGMSYLVESLRILADNPEFDKDRVLIAVAGELPWDFDLPLEFRSLGFLGTDELLALAYQAADVFVCPSVEDSGPMMINESIMCGTPVVSFDMGVAPDLVLTGKTGFRAKLKDSEDLAYGINSILELAPDDASRVSKECRDLGMEVCHPDRQVEGFSELLQSKELFNG